MTHSLAPSVQVFLLSPHNDSICDLLPNRPSAKCTLRDTPKHENVRDFKDALEYIGARTEQKHQMSFFSTMCRIRALEKIVNCIIS